MIDTDKCMDWWKDNRGNYRDNMGNRDGTDAEEELINSLYAEVKRLREEIKDYDACLQNLWDKELIPEDTDIWDEVKELLEVD